jgi:hypothetical protein
MDNVDTTLQTRVSSANDDFGAFDSLPPVVRQALRDAVLKFSAIDVANALTEAASSHWHLDGQAIARDIARQISQAHLSTIQQEANTP